jgi:hypothetical protein
VRQCGITFCSHINFEIFEITRDAFEGVISGSEGIEVAILMKSNFSVEILFPDSQEIF